MNKETCFTRLLKPLTQNVKAAGIIEIIAGFRKNKIWCNIRENIVYKLKQNLKNGTTVFSLKWGEIDVYNRFSLMNDKYVNCILWHGDLIYLFSALSTKFRRSNLAIKSVCDTVLCCFSDSVLQNS